MHTSATLSQHPSFTLPLCKDCRHAAAIGASFIAPQCLHPKGPIIRDLVSGVITGPACRDERGPDGKCGEAGALFSPSADYLRNQHCTNKVRARRLYASRIELVPLCEVADLRDSSDSTNRSNSSACSGCARPAGALAGVTNPDNYSPRD